MRPSTRVCDDRGAISNFVGIVVLVAVTLLVAVGAGLFVFVGGDDELTTASPNANFDFEYDQTPQGHDVLVITHVGGEGIPGDELRVEISGTNDPETNDRHYWVDLGGSQAVTEGESIVVERQTTGATVDQFDMSDAQVALNVRDENSGQTYRVATWTGPDVAA